MGFKLVLSVSLIVGALGIASTLTDGQDQRAGCQPLKEKGTWEPPTPPQTSGQGNPGCGSKTKMRKSYTDLSEDEKIALKCAMQDIITDGSFGHLANFHGGPHTICSTTTGPHQCCTHHGTDFLTWHRLYLVNFERALEPYLIKYGQANLGLPYWDWTASLKIPTLFDDLPFHTIFDVAKYYHDRGLLNGTQEISGNGSFIMIGDSGEMVDWTSRWRRWTNECSENGLRPTETTWNSHWNRNPRLNTNTKGYEVDMNDTDINDFQEDLERGHARIHVFMTCAMSILATAAYDPVFWMHHAHVDKIFADWQNIPGNSGERQKMNNLTILEPFNLPANHYKDFTMINGYEAWDYKNKLCYEYCPTGSPCPMNGSSGANGSTGSPPVASPNTRLYILTAYVLLVFPKDFGGIFELEHCYSETDCKTFEFPCFGEGPIDCDKSLPVNKKHFTLQRELFNWTDQSAFDGGLQSTPPIDVQWTSLNAIGKFSKDHTPKSAPPLMMFKILDSNTHANKRFVQLAPGVSKNQYGDLLDDYDVREYCDKFEVDESDPFARKTEYWLNWQLGNANLCTN